VLLICEWFQTRGFDLQWLSERDAGFGVGVHRFAGEPKPLALGLRMFDFVGYEVLKQAKTGRLSLRAVAVGWSTAWSDGGTADWQSAR
jgi:hypothetical protein